MAEAFHQSSAVLQCMSGVQNEDDWEKQRKKTWAYIGFSSFQFMSHRLFLVTDVRSYFLYRFCSSVLCDKSAVIFKTVYIIYMLVVVLFCVYPLSGKWN